jgi:hypothetical protein
MIGLAMIDVMAARLAGGRAWRNWRNIIPAPAVITVSKYLFTQYSLTRTGQVQRRGIGSAGRAAPGP